MQEVSITFQKELHFKYIINYHIFLVQYKAAIYLLLNIEKRFVNAICGSLSAFSLHFKFRSMLQTFGLLPESTQLLKRESLHKKTFDFPSFSPAVRLC